MEMYSIKDLETRKENKCWVVKINNEKQHKALKQYFPNIWDYNKESNAYIVDKTNSGIGDFYYYSNISYNKILFNQIKELNMKEKEIIGYKLIKPEYEEAFKKIVNTSCSFKNNLEYGICFQFNSPYATYAKKAGVLDIWFEPVYKPEKPKEVIVEMGSFSLTVKPEGIFHKNEDITSYVKGIESWWKNDFNSGNLKFGVKNYDCLIPASNIIIEKSGCESNQTKLSNWLFVYEEYLKIKQ